MLDKLPNIAFVLICVFSGSFLLLRKLKDWALKPGLPRWDVKVSGVPSWMFILSSGVLSWMLILSSAGWILLTLFLLVDLFVSKHIFNMYMLFSIVIVTGLLYRLGLILDPVHIMDFVRTSLFFRPYASQPFLISDELDKKKVRDMYKEVTGKTLKDLPKERVFKTDEEIEQIRKEILTSQQKLRLSSSLEKELRELRSGAVADISDPWKIYTLDHSLHDFYEHMTEIRIDPKARLLFFRLYLEKYTRQNLQTPLTVIHLKQDLYDFLQLLNTEAFLKSYTKFFDRIAITCYGTEFDEFEQGHFYPFLTIDIATKQLHLREGKFFNAPDLHKIAALTFNSGERLA